MSKYCNTLARNSTKFGARNTQDENFVEFEARTISSDSKGVAGTGLSIPLKSMCGILIDREDSVDDIDRRDGVNV